MIKSLALTNFKSIGKTLMVKDEEITEGKLDFAPLTIFCGKNSSGKSTVLQSILLLAQTLQNNNSKQSLVLNGPMAKLGTIKDIKSEFINSKDITFDMNFTFSNTTQQYHNECIEKYINVEGYGNLKYFLSNNLDDLEKAIFTLTGFNHYLDDAKWYKNTELSSSVKKIMDKYQVIYSMTIYNRKGIMQLVVNKHFENNWFISGFAKIKGRFYPTKYDKLETLDPTKLISFNDKIIHEKEQDINLCLSFCNKKQNEISNIIPIIKQINLVIDKTFLKATFKNKSENLINITKDFEYYNIELDNNTKKEIEQEISNNKIIGLTLNHFIPNRLWYEKNFINEIVENLNDYFFNRFLSEEYVFDEHSIKELTTTINQLYKLINDFFKDKDIKMSQFMEFTIPENIKNNNKQTFIKYVKKLILQLKKANINYLFQNWVESFYKNKLIEANLPISLYKYYPANSFDVKSINENAKIINNYFNNNVYYIGPLREEPHLQYDKYSNDIINIGIKGENCANVLYFNKDKNIKYIKPMDIESVIKKESRLNYAVIDWLNYIEIAENIFVELNGRYGYEVKINSFNKNINNDLTNVGVGVSQVLPIILSCLLAPEKSTIIIEQPELHLHPAMQSKLTDFFISMILCNKQLIIETHSEHIINRLRLRAINLQTEKPINDSVKIYFTENLKKDEKEYKKGNTLFSQLNINEYGAISDWPEGFFDESSENAEEIFNAASLKWKQKKETNND